MYKHKWLTPDRKTKSKIDHILFVKRHKRHIKQVRTYYRGADRDIDHYLVIANFKTKLSRVWIRDKTKTRHRKT